MSKIDCYTSTHTEPESIAERLMDRYGFSKYRYYRFHVASGKESIAEAGFRNDTMFLNSISRWNEMGNGTWIYSTRGGSITKEAS